MNGKPNGTGVASAALMFFLLAGCSHLPLYSEARDKQGQAAKKAWSEVDAAGQIDAARAELDKLLERELAAEEQFYLSTRDDRIRALVLGGSLQTQYIDPLDRAVRELVGDPQQLPKWKRSWDSRQAAKLNVDQAREDLADLGVEMPTCDAVAKNDVAALTPLDKLMAIGDTRGKAIAGALDRFGKSCAAAALTELAPAGGEIAETTKQLATAASKLEELRAITLNARNAYRAALAAHENAASRLQSDPNAGDDLRQAAADVTKAVDVLKDAQDLFSEQFVAAQRLDSLNRVLASIAQANSGDDVPSGTSRAAVALVLFTELSDRSRHDWSDARQPTLVPLLLHKRIEQIRFDAATRDLAREQSKATLYEQRLATQAAQADAFLQAKQSVLADSSYASMTLAEALAEVRSPSGKQSDGSRRSIAKDVSADAHGRQQNLLQGLGRYFDGRGRLAGEIAKVDDRLLGLQFESALLRAESNVAQWQVLIGTGVDQLAIYGGSGIKPDMVLALLNSLSLLWIGMGVH